MDSILNSIKKLLGIYETDTCFDTDITIHINSVFSTLNQLGIGPPEGFYIESNAATWSDFLTTNDPRLNSVKTYMYLKVKLLFDPPQSSKAVESTQQLIKEYEWRLNMVAENDKERIRNE